METKFLPLPEIQPLVRRCIDWAIRASCAKLKFLPSVLVRNCAVFEIELLRPKEHEHMRFDKYSHYGRIMQWLLELNLILKRIPLSALVSPSFLILHFPSNLSFTLKQFPRSSPALLYPGCIFLSRPCFLSHSPSIYFSVLVLFPLPSFLPLLYVNKSDKYCWPFDNEHYLLHRSYSYYTIVHVY